jgi:zinc/manganese transport system ATP-binding protein
MHTSTSITPTEQAAQIYQSNSSPVIAAEDLTAGYKNVTVWRNASLALDQGEFVAVIGPNGAGKTTLFRLLLGLQQPLGGTIRVFNARPKRGNSQIGYVPQRHVIDSDTNIESLQLVRLGLAGRKLGLGLFSDKDTKAALQALEDVGARALAHRPRGELSGGELQRVFLAEALVSSPGLLLLDEPLSNLDIKRERELLQVVNKVVRSRGVTALLIAHHINPLLPYLDRLVYIANGRVAMGKPGEVLTSKSLSALYGVEVEVLHDSKGNIAIVGLEDIQDEHEN